MEGIEPSIPLVCDAGPIIHLDELDELDALDLLVDLFLRRTQLLFLETISIQLSARQGGMTKCAPMILSF